MAGRGRGKTGSLTQEQLQSLGCVGKDMPQVQTAPPPTFPPLMSKPIALETTPAQSYQILWKEHFLNHMRDSPYFLQTLETNKTNQSIQSYSQKNANVTESNKMKAKAEFNWSLMPNELQIANRKRRTVVKSKDIKMIKSGNIEDRLKQLEEKERTESEKETGKANSDSEQEIVEDEIVDEEMDDENDYGNSYFDNGEAYNEEDDNLDDGPVY